MQLFLKLLTMCLWVYMTVSNGMLLSDYPALRRRLLWTVVAPSLAMMLIICLHA